MTISMRPFIADPDAWPDGAPEGGARPARGRVGLDLRVGATAAARASVRSVCDGRLVTDADVIDARATRPTTGPRVNFHMGS